MIGCSPGQGSARARIAEQHGVSLATVQRAGEFADAVDMLGLEQSLLRGDLHRVVLDADGHAHERRIPASDIIEAAERVAAGECVDAVVGEMRTERPHVAHNSGNPEWYTPAPILDAAREVLGHIDLDPASNDIAQQSVRATTYYTAEQNGLEQDWRGTTWLNPPYAQPLVGQFTRKLIESIQTDAVPAALLLVNNSTDSRWFQAACGVASRICLVRGRIKFHQADGERGSPLQGQCVLYFGADPERFVQAFSKFGIVLRPEIDVEEVRQ